MALSWALFFFLTFSWITHSRGSWLPSHGDIQAASGEAHMEKNRSANNRRVSLVAEPSAVKLQIAAALIDSVDEASQKL